MAEEKSNETLTPAQQRVAELIRNRAVELGVDPRLALALAYRENKFTNNPGSLDEIGIMQVRPGTAKQYGFNPKDLTDETKNIDIGLQILKKHLDRFQGYPNTAVMAAAAYNAGPDHPFFTNPEKNQLPESTQAYLRDINSLKGFEGYTQIGTGQETDKTKEPSLREKAGKLFQDAKGVAAQAVKEYPEALRAGIDVGGALAGRKLSVLGEGLRREFQTESARTPPAQPRAAAPAPSAAPTGQPSVATSATVPSTAPAAAPTVAAQTAAARQVTPVGPADAGRMAPGQTGAMVYNYGKAAGLTDIEAAQALDMTKETGGVHDLSTTRREGTQRVRSMFPGERYVENPRFGGLLTLEERAGAGPRSSFVLDQPTPPQPGQPAQPGGLRNIPPPQPVSAALPPPPPEPPPPKAPLSSQAARAFNIGSRVMPGALGFLGGLGAAEMGQEAYSRAQTGDIPGSLISALGAAGSLATVFPYTPTRLAGAGIAALSPLTLLLYDKAKERAIRQAQGYGALAAGKQLPAPSIYQGYFGP